MMVIASRSRRARQVCQSLGLGVLLLGVAGASGVSVAPASAQATPHAKVTTGPALAGHVDRALVSSLCSRVSAASIAAIVGHSVPAPVANTVHQAATAKNFGISGVLTLCTYGAETSVAAISKVVVLEYEVTSKPITISEIQQKLKQTSPTSKLTLTPYSGLGVPAFYFVDANPTFSVEGMEGVAGTKSFGATVFAKNLSKSKLAALTKLAEKL